MSTTGDKATKRRCEVTNLYIALDSEPFDSSHSLKILRTGLMCRET
jgi:hypothetical protein